MVLSREKTNDFSLMVTKLVNNVLLVSLLLSGVGCTQWKRLIGEKDKEDAASIPNLGKIWTGRITVEGKERYIFWNVSQDGTSLTPPGYFHVWDIDNLGHITAVDVVYGGVVSGTVGKNTFAATFREGFTSPCSNYWYLDGSIAGGGLSVRLHGLGNSGAPCYDKPIDAVTTLN